MFELLLICPERVGEIVEETETNTTHARDLIHKNWAPFSMTTKFFKIASFTSERRFISPVASKINKEMPSIKVTQDMKAGNRSSTKLFSLLKADALGYDFWL